MKNTTKNDLLAAIKKISAAVNLYRNNNGSWPEDDRGFASDAINEIDTILDGIK
jgi:hypothetical protein